MGTSIPTLPSLYLLDPYSTYRGTTFASSAPIPRHLVVDSFGHLQPDTRCRMRPFPHPEDEALAVHPDVVCPTCTIPLQPHGLHFICPRCGYLDGCF